ncbi:hypothetical protein A2U01_0110233, partial [Trifolium medium]|nr:hypothetical protein [Trifolium medium]
SEANLKVPVSKRHSASSSEIATRALAMRDNPPLDEPS